MRRWQRPLADLAAPDRAAASTAVRRERPGIGLWRGQPGHAAGRGVPADGPPWRGRAGPAARSAGRIRQHEGPKRLRERDPGLLQALDRLIDPDTGGDPESPLRWTCKSTRALAETLTAKGHPVSDDTVGRLLKQQGYRLQRTVNTLRAPNIPTGTPSSAISTSRLGRIWPPGSR
jgi:hypothetical protein